MKNTILSNLIDFAVYHDIQNKESNKASRKEVDCFSYEVTHVEITEIWDTLMENFKLDKLSIYLLENFSNAIKTENYKAAAKMKQEIYNQWNCPSNAHFLKTGFEYLFKLRKGLENSELHKNKLRSMDYLEKLWMNKGLANLEKILKELAHIDESINSHEASDVLIEALDAIGARTYTHPILVIKRAMEYFWALNQYKD